MARTSAVQIGAFMALVVIMLSTLPSLSLSARVYGVTSAAEPQYLSKASIEMCPTDFSKESYTEVTVACAPQSDQGATAACCAAFKKKACQYEVQVNDFSTMCPVLFMDYLNAAGPYPAGYFVGRCVDGTKGFCVRP